MSHLFKTITLATFVAFAGPAVAQDGSDAPDAAPSEAPETGTGGAAPSTDGASSDETSDDAPDGTGVSDQEGEGASGEEGAAATGNAGEPAGPGLSMGEETNAPSAGDDESDEIGTSYTAETFEDWEQRCVRTEEEQDPCQLYQLLRDENGNAVAEMSIFALPEDQQAAAGATIITPLETLLTRQVTLAVDDGQAKRYPFDFCVQQGCFSRIGLTDDEVATLKRGASATVTIYPAAAPDQEIVLTVSLAGFTAGYDTVAATTAE